MQNPASLHRIYYDFTNLYLFQDVCAILYLRTSKRPLARASARIQQWPLLPLGAENALDQLGSHDPVKILRVNYWFRGGPEREKDEDPNWKVEGSSRVVPRNIHILGIGRVGKFIAHSLAGIPDRPPVTLLLHHRGLYKSWIQEGEAIELITHGLADRRQGFNVELTQQPNEISERNDKSASSGQHVIHTLIVVVKVPMTITALSSVAHRLTRTSTVLFLQNGMGIMDEVNEKIFPDIETRPNYMLGVISHGLNSEKTFVTTHAGQGTIALGLVPRYSYKPRKVGEETPKDIWAPSSRYLLRTLTRTPVLAAVGFSPTDLTQLQLEKLAVNAIINPLTAIFDCRNGELRYKFEILRVMRLLIAEISLVIRSLPELQSVPNVDRRFGPDRLEKMTIGICTATAQNISSMLQDVRDGKVTEIDYINGYIIRRGEEIGIKCVMNYMLMQMVKGKRRLVVKAQRGLLPLDGKRDAER